MKNQCALKTEIKQSYVVKGKVAESTTVSTLKLELAGGGSPSYRPGQFINIYFPELNTPEGKAYSISSAPYEGSLRITVRSMGEFSRRLCALRSGDSLTASLPYGYFFSESDESALVMIAGGIGITPFRSIIMDSIERNPSRKLTLFYSSRTCDDMVFKKEFDDIQKAHGNFNAAYFVTREKSPDPSVARGRMSIADIVGGSPPKTVSGREFLICGSIPFVGAMWKGLRGAGIPEEDIYTEAFFSH